MTRIIALAVGLLALACSGATDGRPPPEPGHDAAPAPVVASAPAEPAPAAAPATIADWTPPAALATDLGTCANLAAGGTYRVGMGPGMGNPWAWRCEGTWKSSGRHLAVDSTCTEDKPTEDGSEPAPYAQAFGLDVTRMWTRRDDESDVQEIVVGGVTTEPAYRAFGLDIAPGTYVVMGCDTAWPPAPDAWIEIVDGGGGAAGVARAGGVLSGKSDDGFDVIAAGKARTPRTGIVEVLVVPGHEELGGDVETALRAAFANVTSKPWAGGEAPAPITVVVGSQP